LAGAGVLFQDGIGFGGPLEGLWLGVALGDPGLDCGFEIGAQICDYLGIL
jgi:hypothetical protein